MSGSCIDKDILAGDLQGRPKSVRAAVSALWLGLQRWFGRVAERAERRAEADLLAHFDDREIKELEHILRRWET